MADFWPSSVPRTLWQFGLLVDQNHRDFPFIGIAVSWEFVGAFVAGIAIICAFAWKRFSEPTFDVNDSAFSDFKDLKLWNLKDSPSLRRAYLVYCVSLICIYGVFAFFGKVIVRLVSDLHVSGLAISVGTVQFDSWQWPLGLALGIAGFAPLLNGLVPVERWLRQYSHEVVGIPTRLREKTIRLKTLIEGDPSKEPAPDPQHWVKAALEPRLGACFLLRTNLGILAEWSYKEHAKWTDPEIRRKLNEYERDAREKTEIAIRDFDLITQKNETDPKKETVRKADLTKTVATLDAMRDKFSVIAAIYCDSPSSGLSFEEMASGKLKESISASLVDRNELPGSGLPLYAFLFVFLAYYVAVSIQWHPPISSIPLTKVAVLTTASIETLKVFFLLWLPMVAVASFASVVFGPGTKHPSGNESVLWTIPGALAAFAVAAVGMTLVAILYSALPSSNTTQMLQSLVGGGDWTGALIYYLLLAPVAAFCFGFVNAVRAPAKPPGKLVITGFAVAAMVLTLVYLTEFTARTSPGICHRATADWPVRATLIETLQGLVDRIWHGLVDLFRSAPPADTPPPALPVDPLAPPPVDHASPPTLRGSDLQTCFSYYATLDLIVIPLAVFFSVFGLMRVRSQTQGRLLAWAGLALAVVAAAWLIGTRGNAAESSPRRDTPVVLGFRTDVQPFSFVPPPDESASQRQYVGYVADLCYEIFRNSGYVEEDKSVTAADRFRSMRRPGETAATDKIDVLCDATTVRLDDRDRTDAGVFSPLIFVTGVSYLQTSVREFSKVELGFVGNSTAARVAEEACTRDALRRGSLKKQPECRWAGAGDCRASWEAAPAAKTGKNTPSLADRTDNVPEYVLCPKPGHDELVEWFCTKNGADKAYFGDRDIILAKVADWTKKGKSCDDYRDSGQFYTYEPYALLISRDDPELIAFVQRRVYEIFSHRDGAEALFHKWFPPPQVMSEPLGWLFVLNGVMDQDELLSGPKAFDAIRRVNQNTDPWFRR